MKQGEIWLINLNPTIGAEIQKTRPAIIVNDAAVGRLPLKIIVPITDWKEKYAIAPWMIELVSSDENNLKKHSAADCFQVRSLSERRFIRRLGEINFNAMDKIREGLKIVLSLSG
jgi:mRNA interferase MazF